MKITYDPDAISLETLLDWFWKIHDPTDPRGVWPDFGPPYRSILLPADEGQRNVVERSKAAAEARLGTIATQVVPLAGTYFPAEAYHQDYAKRNPGDRYVRRVAIPKLKKLGLSTP